MLPNLLLLGAQKSASTFLSTWLSNHPDIYIQSREDRSFEDPEFEDFQIQNLDREFSSKYFGIRRPDYFGKEKYHSRLYKFLPEAKIIIILRNPVKRAISAYYHYMKYGIIKARKPSFILEILNGNYDEKTDAYKNILEYGLYFKKYKHLTKFYSPQNILLINQKDVVNSNKGFLKIIEFLNIENQIPEKPQNRPQQSIYNWRLLRFRQLYLKYKYTYDTFRNKSYDIPHTKRSFAAKTLIRVLNRLELILKQWIFVSEDQIPETLESALKNYYKKDLQLLSSKTGLNLL